MERQRYAIVVLSIAMSLILAGQITIVTAGEPQEKIRATIDAVVAILQDETLNAPERKKERRAKIRQAVTDRFGFQEMAKRSLGRHWRKMKPAQREEFIPLFSDLLERSYITKIESVGSAKDFKIHYTKESIEKDGYAQVRTEIENKRDLNYKIEYRLLQNKGNWEVYDIVIEEVSLVNNYRTQFNKVIRQTSYEELVKKLKLKAEQIDAADS